MTSQLIGNIIKLCKNVFYTKSETDTQLGGKSDTGHTHVKSNITDFAHTHVKADISNFSHNHTKSNITDFAHNHTKSNITDFNHTHVKNDISNFNHTHPKSQISDFAHEHTRSDITNFTHTHSISQVTDLQTRLDNRYTKYETDNLLNGKANTNHNHDNSYYTKSQIESKQDFVNYYNGDNLQVYANDYYVYLYLTGTKSLSNTDVQLNSTAILADLRPATVMAFHLNGAVDNICLGYITTGGLVYARSQTPVANLNLRGGVMYPRKSKLP